MFLVIVFINMMNTLFVVWLDHTTEPMFSTRLFLFEDIAYKYNDSVVFFSFNLGFLTLLFILNTLMMQLICWYFNPSMTRNVGLFLSFWVTLPFYVKGGSLLYYLMGLLLTKHAGSAYFVCFCFWMFIYLMEVIMVLGYTLYAYYYYNPSISSIYTLLGVMIISGLFLVLLYSGLLQLGLTGAGQLWFLVPLLLLAVSLMLLMMPIRKDLDKQYIKEVSGVPSYTGPQSIVYLSLLLDIINLLALLAAVVFIFWILTLVFFNLLMGLPLTEVNVLLMLDTLMGFFTFEPVMGFFVVIFTFIYSILMVALYGWLSDEFAPRSGDQAT